MRIIHWCSSAVTLCVLASSTYGCSSDDDDDDASSSSSSSSSGGSSSSSGAADSYSASSSGETPQACSAVAAATWAATAAAVFVDTFDPQLPGEPVHTLTFELDHAGATALGNFDLAVAPNHDVATCTQCLLARSAVDPEATPTYYFQSTGSVAVTAVGARSVTATYRGVQLVEVTVDPVSHASTVVPYGRCLTLADGAITVPSP